MRDGRIVARKVTSYFDAGAYTRLSSYGAVKCIAHVPGPYTIPNVHADVLLRLHQPHAGDRHARLRHHRRRFLARGADGQAGPQGRHGPDGVPHPQRLPRRGHEGAPARGAQLRADRVRAGGGREGELADPRRVPAHELAYRRRRRARRHSRHGHRRGTAASAPGRPATRARRRARRRSPIAPPPRVPQPAAAQPRVAPPARPAPPPRRHHRRAAAPRRAAAQARRSRPAARRRHASPACSARGGGEPWPSIADAAWPPSTTRSA